MNVEAPPVPKICARLRLTSKNPLRAKAVLKGEGQLVEEAHPENVFGSRIPLVVPRFKTNGGVFVGVVPVQARKAPVPVNGLLGPVIGKSLADKDEAVPYVNLSRSEFLLILDVSVEDVSVEVTIGAAAPEALSKEGLRVPDVWMRVDVELKGIKSIYRIALDGAASKRIAVAMPATPKSE